MYYSVPEAAGLLGITEDLVYDWIRNEGLPANFYSGHYHISRVKLIDWAHRNHFPLAVEGSVSAPVLEEALQCGGILRYSSDSMLDAICEALIRSGQFNPDNVHEILTFLNTRDNFGWAIDERRIALPLTKSPLAVISGSSRVYISYIEPNGLDVPRILFVILTSSPRMHLNLLSRCIFAVGNPAFRARLEDHSDSSVLIETMKSISIEAQHANIKLAVEE